MRVVLSVPQYPPWSRVGAWIATHDYLAALVRRGHRVDVVTARSSRPRYVLDGVHVHPVTDHVGPVDLFVGHLGGDQTAAQLARAHGVPVVQFAHTDHEAPEPIADLLVCNSKATAAAIDHPSILGRPVLDVARHRTTPGDRVTVVNLSANKGGDLLRVLAPALPRVEFLGVRGGYGRQISPSARNVETIPTTHDMPGDVWARTRILLCPSARESWGMVGLEAMASGIPVIAHPTPGLRESLGSAGIFVDRTDVAGWADAIGQLEDFEAWAAASAAALARVDELPDDRPAVCESMEKVSRCLTRS